MPLQGLLGLQSVAGYTYHRDPFPLDPACLDELPCARQGDTACGLGKDAFCPGQQLNRVDDLLVETSSAIASGVPDDLRCIKAVSRIADSKGLRYCIRVSPA